MAALTKANLMDDLANIQNRSGSPGAFLVNAVNYVYDIYVTQASASATTVHEASAQTDLLSGSHTFPGGNSENTEQFRA